MNKSFLIFALGILLLSFTSAGTITTTLNSPANGATQYTTLVTTNASATVTGGAYLVNATLYDNSTGTWGARNTTLFNVGQNFSYTKSTFSPTSGGGNFTGIKISVGSAGIKILTLTKDASDASTIAYILYSNLSVISGVAWSSNNATFNQELPAGTYYLVGGQNAGNYAYSTASLSFPYQLNGFNVTDGKVVAGDAGGGQWATITNIYYQNSTSTSSTTQTFANTYPSASNTLWNYQFCDSDGTCDFATANRTFSIDSSAPTITLNYPTSLINYGAVNGTLQLNTTATDTNLDKVWYNYNGTNITIAGAVTGVANLSNITLSTAKSIIIYANDTAGNLNATTFNWDYRVFENSKSYSTTIVETSVDTFSINVTANLSLSSVYLNYNGVDYSTSNIGGGVYQYNLSIPSVTATTTKQFYWRFVYAGTNITSSIYNQTVSKLTIQLCNGTTNQTLIRFYTKSASNPFPSVNSTFKSTWTISATDGGTPSTFNYEDLNNNVSTYEFCTNTNQTTFYYSATIEYDATGYSPNFYYLNDANMSTSNPQNITLYLLNDTLATTTVLKVQDEGQQPKEGYTIQIQFYDVGTGTFYLIGMAKTDYKGEDVVYLNWYDSLYKFIVLDENLNVVKTTNITKITSTPTTITITDTIDYTYEKFLGFVYSLYFQNSTNNFVLTYTKPSGEVDQACLRVYKQSPKNNTLICDTCETSASATLFCNIGGYGNGTYTAVFYATGSYKLLDWMNAYIGGNFQQKIYDLLGNTDASFYAFLFATLVVVALFVNAIFGIIALMIGIIGASALGFTAIQWGQMMGVAIIGGLIIWLIKR